MDEVVNLIGPFGYAQKVYALIMGNIAVVNSMLYYSSVFYLAEPSLHCNSARQNEPDNNSSQSTLQTCDMWSAKEHYDCKFTDPYYNLTLINDLHLICEKKYLPSLTQTIFFIGALCSAFSGTISDRIGRQKVLRMLVLIQTCSIVVNHFLVSNHVPFIVLDVSIRFIIYCVYQFAVGFLTACIIMTCVVLLVELTVDKYHNLVTIFILVFFGLGEIVLALVFYVTKNWKATNLFICLYSIVNCVSFWLILPESPRWLAAIKRFDKANENLKRMAKLNGKLDEFDRTCEMSLLSQETEAEEDENEEIDMKTRLKQIVYPFANFYKTFAFFLLWNILNMVYIGVALGILNVIDMNPYLTFLLSALFEIFGALVCFLNGQYGRKPTIILYLLIFTASACLISFIPDDENVTFYVKLCKLLLILLGKGILYSAYNTTYIFTVESYDIKVRNTVIVFMYSAGSILSLISPQINLLRTLVWKPLPYLIYAASTLFAFLFMLFVPETLHNEK